MFFFNVGFRYVFVSINNNDLGVQFMKDFQNVLRKNYFSHIKPDVIDFSSWTAQQGVRTALTCNHLLKLT